jgi:hypothetical protein
MYPNPQEKEKRLHQLTKQKTPNYQWVLVADDTKVLLASFFPDCPNARELLCLVMTKHILMLPRYKFCVLLYTL